ncbi:hypothetical protein Bbelb_110780 [Branchiostoma belcheri]|nr:hypothetical protein Bbelb_110780 [Branchiostoma belcheri]
MLGSSNGTADAPQHTFLTKNAGKIPKGSGVESLQQVGQDLEVGLVKEAQNTPLSLNGGVSTLVRLRSLDGHSQVGETAGRLLHEDVKASLQCKMGTTLHKQGAVCWTPTTVGKDTSQTSKVCRALSEKQQGDCLQPALWSPAHGRRKPGRPPLTYLDVLQRDTGLQADGMGKAMQDRSFWAAMVVRVADEDWYPT